MIELAQPPSIYCQPAENDVVAGTERVKSWLHTKQLWFVERLCPLTIKQMKAYRWAPDRSKDGQVRKERIYKKDDELPDCIRYAVMTWPMLPKAPPVEEVKARDLSHLPDDMRRALERIRKIDKEPALDKIGVVGDFYL